MLDLLKQMAYLIVVLAANQTVSGDGVTSYPLYSPTKFLSALLSSKEPETRCQKEFKREFYCGQRQTSSPSTSSRLITARPDDQRRTTAPPFVDCVRSLNDSLTRSISSLQEELINAIKELPRDKKKRFENKNNKTSACNGEPMKNDAVRLRLQSCQKLICKSQGLALCSSCERSPTKNCSSLSIPPEIATNSLYLKHCFKAGSLKSKSTTQQTLIRSQGRSQKRGQKARIKRQQKKNPKNSTSKRVDKTALNPLRKTRKGPVRQPSYVSKSIDVKNEIDCCIRFISHLNMSQYF